MKDLVEFVIDGILQQEKLQKQPNQAQTEQAGLKFKQTMSSLPADQQAHLHSVGPQTTAATTGKKKNEALWKTSLQLEAIFVQQMMSEMRKTVNKSDFIKSGFAQDMHASMMDEAIAQSSTRHSTFGIASSIYRQLEASEANRQTETSTQEISHTADKIKMASDLIANDLTLEARKHAH